MSDTPRSYCNGCEPDADEFAEFLILVHCGRHYPSASGLDDAGVVSSPEEKVTNQQWCALLHGAARLTPLLLLAALLTACTPNAAKFAEALCKNQVSQCWSVTTIYGSARGACSGLRNGTVACSSDGSMTITAAEPK
jgi:hypothetical protein